MLKFEAFYAKTIEKCLLCKKKKTGSLPYFEIMLVDMRSNPGITKTRTQSLIHDYLGFLP